MSAEKIEDKNTLQSPNWDKYKDYKGGVFMIQGFPFNEGWPPEDSCDKIYEIILRDGVGLIKHDARVDYSTQYRAEGLQWRTTRGEVFDKHCVVAWKQKEEITK